MSPEELTQRAERARQLLEDPLLKESFDETERALIRAAQNVKTEAEAFRTVIALQVLNLVRNMIQSHVETGKIVQFNAKQDERKKNTA